MSKIEKIAITVQIPALGGSYEFIVPDNMSVRNAQQLILKSLHYEFGIQDKLVDVMLFDQEDGRALCLDCSFAQLDISDGAKLMLL